MPNAGNVHSLLQQHPPVGIVKSHRPQVEERALMQAVRVILRCLPPLSYSATTCANDIRSSDRSQAAQMYPTIHLAVDLAPHQILHHLLFLTYPWILLRRHLLSTDYIIPILSCHQHLDHYNFPHSLPSAWMPFRGKVLSWLGNS
jgi:hypothetical protein